MKNLFAFLVLSLSMVQAQAQTIAPVRGQSLDRDAFVLSHFQMARDNALVGNSKVRVGYVAVNQQANTLRLTLIPQSPCGGEGPHRICAAVVPMPVVVDFKIVSVTRTGTGRKIVAIQNGSVPGAPVRVMAIEDNSIGMDMVYSPYTVSIVLTEQFPYRRETAVSRMFGTAAR